MLIIKRRQRDYDPKKAVVTLSIENPPALTPLQRTCKLDELDYSTLCALADIGRTLIVKPMEITVIQIMPSAVRLGFEIPKLVRCQFHE